MANKIKIAFLEELKNRFGPLTKIGKSLSLYEIADASARIYIRYSKIHSRNQAFYGLRKEDLLQLEGYPSVICFLWEEQQQPVFLPYSDYEDIFHEISPANDGQYKAQIYFRDEGDELYIANAGRFNVSSYFGWQNLATLVKKSKMTEIPSLSHTQVQTLIGSIGWHKGFDIWIPINDRGRLDWSLSKPFKCATEIPYHFKTLENIISVIDVLWIERGAGNVRAFFEVEHSTPIYSGLLRFNDVYLTVKNLHATYNIVSSNERRSLFVNQLSRPTFKASGLDNSCSFMDYLNVFIWHQNIDENRTK